MLVKSIWDSCFLFSFFFSVFSFFVRGTFAFLPTASATVFFFCTWVMKWIEKTIECSDSVPFGYVRL